MVHVIHSIAVTNNHTQDTFSLVTMVEALFDAATPRGQGRRGLEGAGIPTLAAQPCGMLSKPKLPFLKKKKNIFIWLCQVLVAAHRASL